MGESMSEPLSKSQQALRGRTLTDMTEDQLRDWIDACNKMEVWPHTAKKARHDWKLGGNEAMAELERRQSESKASN